MYLAALCVALDIEPEVTRSDRERLLRSLREKLKQKLHHRVTIGVDYEDVCLFMSFFDENFERCKARIDSLYESIEAAGEARIRFYEEQIYRWFDGQFVEAASGILQAPEMEVPTHRKLGHFQPSKEKTIVYADSEEDDMVPISSRFSRRNLRIPTRK